MTDASGTYRIRFTATPLPGQAGRFVARAEIVADRFELYWRSRFATSSSNIDAAVRLLHRITRMTVGASTTVSLRVEAGKELNVDCGSVIGLFSAGS